LGNSLFRAFRVALFLTALALVDLGGAGQWRCVPLLSVAGYSNNWSFIHGVNNTPFAVSGVFIPIFVISGLHVLFDYLKVHNWQLWLMRICFLDERTLALKELLVEVDWYSFQR
jgi:hypothetical protein